MFPIEETLTTARLDGLAVSGDFACLVVTSRRKRPTRSSHSQRSCSNARRVIRCADNRDRRHGAGLASRLYGLYVLSNDPRYCRGVGLAEFMSEWSTPIGTLGLIGVTVWYAVETQRMAKSARASAESAREAAEHSARSAAVAAAGTTVDFAISPTYQIADRKGRRGHWFPGIRVECLEAAVFVHRVTIESVYAPDPDLEEIEPSLTENEIYPQGEIPRLIGLGNEPMLLHRREYVFLDFPEDDWTEAEVATLTVEIDYSFDGKSPPRFRRVEWIGRAGRDYGPYK